MRLDSSNGGFTCIRYPVGALSPRDAKTLSFLAFPDSNLTRADTEDISCLYSFRFRCQDPVMSDDFFEAGSTSDKSRYLFATCLFRQHRDEDNPRGFYQKTIAVISRHPFTDLWSRVVSGPMIEAYAAAEQCGRCSQVLQQVWMDTCKWPKPKPAK
ncbi:Protein dennd6a, partial [Perkinsus olseni]